MQRDINKQVQAHRDQMSEEEKAKADAEEAAKAANQDDEEDSEKSSDEERPAGIVQPKYKIVHSYNHDIADAWEGHNDTLEAAVLERSKKKLPESLTVTIFAKHCENMKGAQLDINESNLVFGVEGLYYLDLNLKYKVDQA